MFILFYRMFGNTARLENNHTSAPNRHTTHMKTKSNLIKKLITGGLTGFCNGLFGGGGGMIAVPFLERLCGFEANKAHASAISIIFPLSVVTGGVYIARGDVDFNLLLYVAPALTVGAIIGAKLTGKLNDAWLSRIFTAMMFLAGAWMLFF